MASPLPETKSPLKRVKTIGGHVLFWYPVLSALSKVRTLADAAAFVSGISQQLHEILTWFGLLLNVCLAPWRWVRDLLFWFLPFDVPDAWRDPIVLGMFVWALPGKMFGFIVFSTYLKWQAGKLAAIAALVRTLPSGPDGGRSLAQRIEQQVDAAMLATLELWETIDYVRRLKLGLPQDMLDRQAAAAREQVAVFNEKASALMSRFSEDSLREVVRASIRAAIGVALIILFTLDQLYVGGPWTAASILWRSLIAVCLLALAPFVLLGILMVVGLIVEKVTAPVRRVEALRRFGSNRLTDLLPRLSRRWDVVRSNLGLNVEELQGHPAFLEPAIVVGGSASDEQIVLEHTNLIRYSDIMSVTLTPGDLTMRVLRVDGKTRVLCGPWPKDSYDIVSRRKQLTLQLMVDGKAADWRSVPLRVSQAVAPVDTRAAAGEYQHGTSPAAEHAARDAAPQ